MSAEFPEVAERLSSWLATHLAESKTLLPRKNMAYDPNLNQAGFTMESGGYFNSNASKKKLNVTSNSDRVTLRYTPSGGSTGKFLQFTIMTNCAIGAVGGVGVDPIFGQPISIVADLTPRGRRADFLNSGNGTVRS